MRRSSLNPILVDIGPVTDVGPYRRFVTSLSSDLDADVEWSGRRMLWMRFVWLETSPNVSSTAGSNDN
jgi:hypothetical protein